MSIRFTEGADGYGPVNTVAANVAAVILGAGTWTSASGVQIATGLSSPGQSLLIAAGGSLGKTLSTSESQWIAGRRFSAPLAGQSVLMQFLDSGSAQCTITLETTGIINLRSGGSTGTILASGAVISANSTHYLECDITFGASAAYQLWLDGVSLFSGTGNTRAGTTNNSANQIAISQGGGTQKLDDLYLFDATDTMVVGAPNNAALNNNPRIETQFPTGDSAVQFSRIAAVLGQAYSTTATPSAPGANQLFLRRFTPAVACTINSVACLPMATTAGKYRAVIYSDTSGAPHSLLSSGTEISGTVSGTVLVGALVSPQALIAGTPYWIGFIADTSVALAQVDSTATGVKATNAYTGGAPGTAPTMTAGQSSWMIYGNLTGLSVNWPAVIGDPPLGDISVIASSTVGHEDLYTFPALTTTPDDIYVVAVKVNMRNSDTGTRTVDLRIKSVATTSSGSDAGQTPATSYGWLASYFEADPDTGAAWTPSGVNAALTGQKIAS